MTNSNEEELLRARFADLKRHDRRHAAAPPFDSMWRPPRPARSPLRVIVPVASALAAAAVFIIYCGVSSFSSSPSSPSSPAPTVAIGGETSPPVAARMYEPLPLDFLLEASSASTGQSSRSPLHGW